MYKLIADVGRWATKSNDMIFGNVVYLSERKEANKYHLIDEDGQEITLDKPITDYITTDQ